MRSLTRLSRSLNWSMRWSSSEWFELKTMNSLHMRAKSSSFLFFGQCIWSSKASNTRYCLCTLVLVWKGSVWFFVQKPGIISNMYLLLDQGVFHLALLGKIYGRGLSFRTVGRPKLWWFLLYLEVTEVYVLWNVL